MPFYICPKCKRIWQYPIEKCPECFLTLERIGSEKIKVVGVSKVQIPTMFHPKTPYFVLLLEDENGNKWVQKSVKEYKIGDEFEIKISKDKNSVSIWRIKYDILEGIEKVIAILGGLEVNSETKILILPTLISPRHPYFAENTSPEFLQATIQYLIEIGVRPENIKVVAQSFDEVPIGASAQKSQLLKVCQEKKVLPVDLAEKKFVKKEISGMSFEISKEVFDSDLIINLPILKIGKISATKNILKLLKKENYLGLEYLYLEEEMLENLKEILPAPLTIAEGINIQKSNGYTTFLGLILASFNSLNLDRVFAEITMIKDYYPPTTLPPKAGPSLPEYLKSVKIENIPVLGRQIEELQYEVEKF
jgi:uncharacterized protein (DUF362 family)